MMIAPDEAWRRLEPFLKPLPEENLARRSARGRVLAQDLGATVDVPAADVSAMDGYALGGPVESGARLEVAGTVAAGDPPGFELAAGAAARIMTGALVPPGADRVVPVEQTDGGAETVRIDAEPAAGAHIRRRGEILRSGALLLPAGSLLTPAALSLLATHGYGELPVHRAPRVAVLATGDEVVPPERQPAPGQLRDSHTDFLLAAGESLGFAFTPLGIAPDRAEALRARVAEGLGHDVLILTGGVSMGEYDLVEGVLEELGCTVLFEKVAVQPAKPVVAAHHPGGLVFGLPGNPASAMVAFWLFVRPALRCLSGGFDTYWGGALAATLGGPLAGAKDRDRFLPAEVSFRAGRIHATPVDPVGSHDQAAYARGTALVKVPAEAPPRPAGAPCEVLPLADWWTTPGPVKPA